MHQKVKNMMMHMKGTVLTGNIPAFSVLLLLLSQVSCLHWLEHHKPVQKTSYLYNINELSSSSDSFHAELEELSEFQGNNSHTDHFKLLKEDGTSVLVGARNVIYNLSLPNLIEYTEERIDWSCTPEDKANCDLKGKSYSDCQNYIRVLSVISHTRLLVCGTNCYNPLCRHYQLQNGQYQVEKEFSGKGYTPYDPRHNSTSLYTSGNLFAATVADFSGTDSLIIKNNLRTEQYDYKHLNAPDFVSSLEDEDHVYFFFREAAVEFMNCGKSIYSRVARVCKNDEGGSHKFRNRWTTFLKSRLNCSVPGEYPFYFNEIQSTTNFFTDAEDNHVFYAVFTTPTNSILGSAICRFSLDEVQRSFDGNFKNQEKVNSNWLPMSPSQVPSPRPGKCYNQTASLPESSLHFIKNHCLMDQSVQSTPSMPVFIKYGDSELFTKIALHRGVSDLSGEKFDVLFIGTNRGKVMKIVVNSEKPDIKSSSLQQEIEIFSETVPVLNLLIVEPNGPDPKLIVLSADSVKSIPLHHCHQRHNTPAEGCASCVLLSSPYCAWDVVSSSCVSHREAINKTSLVQLSSECPIEQELPPETTTIVHEISEEETTTEDSEDNVTEEYDDNPVTTIQSLLPISSTLSPISHITECPLCECTCPTLSPIIKIHPTPPEESSFNSTSILLDDIDQNDVEEIENDVLHEKEDYTQLEPEVFQPSTNEQEVSAMKSEEHLLSLDKAVIIAVATGLASLVLGFLCGFFVSRLCNHKSSASVTSSNISLVKPCPIDKPLSGDSGYTTPTNPDNNNTKKSMNILMNIQSKTVGKTERTKVTCAGTLQKVKRVYL